MLKIKNIRELTSLWNQVSDKNIRTFAIICVAAVFSLLVHLCLILVFYRVEAFSLSVLNIFSVFVWGCALFFNCRGQHIRAIELCCSEVVLHSTICVAVLGLDAGFQHYLWAISCMIFLDSRFRFWGTIVASFSFIAVFAALYLLFDHVEYQYALPEYLPWMHTLNIAVAGISLAFSVAMTKQITLVLEKELHYQASRDSLTGLYNRRFMSTVIEKQCALTKRSGLQCSLIMADIDYFKEINDRFGHSEGDLVLSAFGQVLTESVRREDSASRWGGEEFLILLVDSDGQQALNKAEQLRKQIESLKPDTDKCYQISASFGVCQLQEGMTVDAWIQCADTAMYQSKSMGRNHCTLASENCTELPL